MFLLSKHQIHPSDHVVLVIPDRNFERDVAGNEVTFTSNSFCVLLILWILFVLIGITGAIRLLVLQGKMPFGEFLTHDCSLSLLLSLPTSLISLPYQYHDSR